MEFYLGFVSHEAAIDFMNFTKYDLKKVKLEHAENGEVSLYIQFDEINQFIYDLARSIKLRRKYEELDKEIGK